MAKYKGGYQIVSLLGVLVSASLFSTFNAKEMLTKIKGSNLKRIVLTDLVVDGEKKNDIEVQYELDETNKKLTLNGVYGYKIEIDYSTSVTSAGIIATKESVGSGKLYLHTYILHYQDTTVGSEKDYQFIFRIISKESTSIYGNATKLQNSIIHSIDIVDSTKSLFGSVIISFALYGNLNKMNQYVNQNGKFIIDPINSVIYYDEEGQMTLTKFNENMNIVVNATLLESSNIKELQ